MKNARIAIFEDNSDWQDILFRTLESDGHSVVVQARTIEEARERIEDIPADGLDVAIVDGNLTEGKSSGAEGTEITHMLRKKFEQVVVVGFTGTNKFEGPKETFSKGDPAALGGILDFLQKTG